MVMGWGVQAAPPGHGRSLAFRTSEMAARVLSRAEPLYDWLLGKDQFEGSIDRVWGWGEG